jgi:hypothetical protein
MLEEPPVEELATNRCRRLMTRVALGLIWVGGIILAVQFGWEPGMWGRPVTASTYPTGRVLLEIAKITLISVGLYDFLRPQVGTPVLDRAGKAIGVLFITFLWIMLPTGTDEPGYVYVTGLYTLLLCGLLLAVFTGEFIVAAIRGTQTGSR